MLWQDVSRRKQKQTPRSQGSKNGWIKPICDRLGLKRGNRSEKNGVRPYASEQAVENRAIFNKDREFTKKKKPVKVGDMVLSSVIPL
jgi:hypothetical protein